MWPLAVLHLADGVIPAAVDDLFLCNDGIFHVIYQRPANSASVSGVDKAVLRAGVQGIFPVNELRVQHHVALLASAADIAQALPVHKVLGTGHAGSGRCGREVSRCRMVFPLHAEDPVNPAVFVGGQAHVVHIGGGFSVLGHGDRMRPELEMVHAVGAFRHGEEGFAVRPFYPGHHHILAVPFDGAGIEYGMNADPFHQIRIGFRIQVVAPGERGMLGREDGMLVALVNTITFDGRIGALQKPLVVGPQPGQSFFEVHHYSSKNTILSNSLNAFMSAACSKPSQAA